MTDDNKYEELIGKYDAAKKKKNEFDTQMKEIALEIDVIMHEDKINKKEVFITALNETHKAEYVDRTTKSVDYQLLAETVSDEKYGEIVIDKESSYLKIGKVPKPKVKTSKPVIESEVKKSQVPRAKIQK